MLCIEVSTGKMGKGYGSTMVNIGRKQYALRAHRVVFEQTWGITLASSDVVLHTCDNPACINPLHLRRGSQYDNILDAKSKGRTKGRRSGMTHCLQGHEFSPENTWLDKRGSRHCRACWNRRK